MGRAVGACGPPYAGLVKVAPKSIADACREPPLRSLWYRSLACRAGGREVHAWLVEQANLRGFFGAYGPDEPASPLAEDLGLEDLVVGLLAPAAPLDGRTLDVARLELSARREWAEAALFWLLSRIPREERTPAVEQVAAAFSRPPRGYRGFQYDYDPARLIRRPASREDLWRARWS